MVVALRVVLGLIAWASLGIAGPAEIAGRQPPAPSPGLYDALINPWQRWDSWHYEGIASQGYAHGSLEVAFFPLYPGLIRAATLFTGGSVAVAALLVSSLAAIAGLVLIRRLVAADLGDPVAARTVVYVALGPMAMFLVAPYTEAVFLALSASVFLALRSGRLIVAGGLIALAALTRPQGILLLAPAAVVASGPLLAAVRRREWPPIKPGHLVLVLLPAAALVAWLAWTAQQVGLSPFIAEERGWGGHLAWPWDGLVHGLSNTAIYPGPLINAAAVLAWIVLVAVLWQQRRRVPTSYIAYAVVSLAPIIFREEGFGNPWASAPRFALVVFPLAVAMALVTERRSGLHTVWVACSSLLAAATLVVFTHNQFIA